MRIPHTPRCCHREINYDGGGLGTCLQPRRLGINWAAGSVTDVLTCMHSEVLEAPLSLHDDARYHGRRCRIILRAAGIVQMLVVDMQRHYDLIGLVHDAADTTRVSCAWQGLTVVWSVRDRPSS
jgi:hypothetical protein